MVGFKEYASDSRTLGYVVLENCPALPGLEKLLSKKRQLLTNLKAPKKFNKFQNFLKGKETFFRDNLGLCKVKAGCS